MKKININMKRYIIGMMLAIMVMPFVSANLVMDSVHFDPAIVASGDEVDIVIQFHDDEGYTEERRLGNPEYKFQVILTPDDDLTEKYVTIQDSTGNDIQGVILSGSYYNRVYRVKVADDAPAGSYEFKLTGQWFKNGEPLETSKYIRFIMPVKKEGIVLDVATLSTIPAEVRPGDNFIKVVADIQNVGEKDAKNVEVNLDLAQGLKASYSNNNRIWIGGLPAGSSKEATFFVDVDEDAADGVYTLAYNVDYMDLDDNGYSKSIEVPFLVKPRPYLEVVKTTGEGLAGATGQLTVFVSNTGTESAENVDVRIIKQNSQPFNIEVRSDYIGELEPGEVGAAIFDIKVNKDAPIKEHDFKVLIRSKGDSDEGDDTIYTYNRRAKFNVTGVAESSLIRYGIAGAVVVVVLIIISAIMKRTKRGKKK